MESIQEKVIIWWTNLRESTMKYSLNFQRKKKSVKVILLLLFVCSKLFRALLWSKFYDKLFHFSKSQKKIEYCNIFQFCNIRKRLCPGLSCIVLYIYVCILTLFVFFLCKLKRVLQKGWNLFSKKNIYNCDFLLKICWSKIA